MTAKLILPLVLLAAALAGGEAPGQFDPPANYYNSATGTGTTLKNQLHNIIDGHTPRSYNAARSLLQETDEDPNDPDRMILVYDRVSLDVSVINPNGSIPGWDSAATWNREHTWPVSRGLDTNGSPDGSDLHQLRPSFTSTNSQRGNLHFGGAFGQSFGQKTDGGATVWYPGDEDAGMIARQQFYMVVRYDGSDSGTNDLELTTSNSTNQANRLGDLDRLIEWHFAATPDDFEQIRNQRVFGIQNNRNPFVDHPEWAWSVLIDQQNDSRIAIDGVTVPSSGATTRTINYGTVLTGASVSLSTGLTLNKLGNDGTYYEVTTSGAATSSLSGRNNAFRSSGTDTTPITVGLNASTATAGATTGSVTIDNLDITTAGGSGRGANDGDDTINLSLTVLDHATPSFDPTMEVTTLDIDFGQITEGDAAAFQFFDVFNLLGTAGFTADLELTQITGSGDTAQLATTLNTFVGFNALEAGGFESAVAFLSSDTVGQFSATYTLDFADENLPGRDTYQMTLNLSGEVLAGALLGDFNDDGFVDAADYTVWRDGFELGDYDAQDYLDWRNNFGAMSDPGAGSATTPTPEPSGLLLAGIACFAVNAHRRRPARA